MNKQRKRILSVFLALAGSIILVVSYYYIQGVPDEKKSFKRLRI